MLKKLHTKFLIIITIFSFMGQVFAYDHLYRDFQPPSFSISDTVITNPSGSRYRLLHFDEYKATEIVDECARENVLSPLEIASASSLATLGVVAVITGLAYFKLAKGTTGDPFPSWYSGSLMMISGLMLFYDSIPHLLIMINDNGHRAVAEAIREFIELQYYDEITREMVSNTLFLDQVVRRAEFENIQMSDTLNTLSLIINSGSLCKLPKHVTDSEMNIIQEEILREFGSYRAEDNQSPYHMLLVRD